MDITGKIIAVLPKRSGTSARTGNAWASQEYVIETHDTYPKKCVFTVFGEDKITQFNLQGGEEVTVSFDIDAHEWNGRYFNDIRAWNVQRVNPTAAVPNANAPVGAVPPFPPADAGAPVGLDTAAPNPSNAENSTDDLPF